MEKNWTLSHVVMVVRDMDKAIKRFQSIGIDTFGPEVILDRARYKKVEVYGKIPEPGTVVKMKVRNFKIGSLDLELLQPIEGDTFHTEFLKTKGEGVDNLEFIVDDLEKEKAELVEKGVPVALNATAVTDLGELNLAIFDTRNISSIFTELIQKS